MITRKITSRRILKICCGATLILFVIVAAVITTLLLTIFKPKEPDVRLDNFNLTYFPNGTLTVQVDLLVKIKNPNYGSFKYKNTTVSVRYQGIIVAMFQIEPRLVPARGKLNFGISSVDILADKMAGSPKFEDDLSSGSFNFTSSATLNGKVTVNVLKLLKFPSKVFCTCNISFFIKSQDIESSCRTKMKL